MKRQIWRLFALSLIFSLPLSFAVPASASDSDGTIVTGGNEGFAWTSNGGWTNWGLTLGNVHVTDTAITGAIWNTNFGWILFSGSIWGVTNTTAGVVGGSAWGADTGYIYFNNVSIDSAGLFHGTATGNVIGTMNFDCTFCSVRTDWRPNRTTTPTAQPSSTSSIYFTTTTTPVVVAPVPPVLPIVPAPVPVVPAPVGPITEPAAPVLSEPTTPVPSTPTPTPMTGEAPDLGEASSGSFLGAIEGFLDDNGEILGMMTRRLAIIAPIALAVAEVAGTAMFASVASVKDLGFLIYRLWFDFLQFVTFRRRRKFWGTVFDSNTKQPLDPVLVKLLNADTGEIIEKRVTDLAGRFGFLAGAGRYMITVEKSHYVFPSTKESLVTDLVFNNSYHGKPFEVKGESDVLSFNIPMDPVAFDFNQMAKQQYLKLHPFRDFVIQKLAHLLFIVGFVSSVISVWRDPSVLHYCIVGWYVLIFVLVSVCVPKRLWGRLMGSDKKPIAGAFLIIHPAGVPQMILGSSLTASNGRFFLKTVQPGRYELEVTDATRTQKMYSKQVKTDSEGLVTNTIKLG